MTLGEIIRNYTTENQMSIDDFAVKSGISRSQTYNLVRNRNNTGQAITPSLEAVQKVARAIGKNTIEILDMLDDDMEVHVKPKPTTLHSVHGRRKPQDDVLSKEEQEVIERYRTAPDGIKDSICKLLDIKRGTDTQTTLSA